jgi:hypothetical protein
VEPPALVRRGEAQRISEAFNRDFVGKLTTVEGVPALRLRLLWLCNGESSFDFNGLAALKSHVTLDEALLIEAVKCAAGDARHEFQDWFGKVYVPNSKAKNQANLGTLDAVALGEELKMTKQAIDEHERLLTEHRVALLDGTATGASTDVDAWHATLASLRATLPVLEAEYARLIEGVANG